MSKKTNLLKCIENYVIKYKKAAEQINTINKSVDYTAEGKTQQINGVLADFENECNTYHDMAVSIINTAIEALKSKWRNNSVGRLNDTGYQIGLSNTLKLLEMGAITSKDDVLNIIDTYKEDYTAMAAIEKLLVPQASKFKDIDVCQLFWNDSKDNRERNITLLNQTITNIDKYISVKSLNPKCPDKFIDNTILGITDFINNKLNDNLELVD